MVIAAAALPGCHSRNAATIDPETAMIDAHAATLRASVAGPVDQPRTQVLLLGTFHFANPGLDGYKPKYSFDSLGVEGQAQVDELLDRLADFRPTKICVEYPSDRQEACDAWYNSYLAGTAKPDRNETVTVGFALAKRLGLKKVYAIDADGYWLPIAPADEDAETAIAKRLGQTDLLDSALHRRYMAMYGLCDDIEQTLTLRQRLRLLNHPDYIMLGHGHYFIGRFGLGDGKEFPGPDAFPTKWHNRNLRMFSNIQRASTDPADRVLAIVGSGHVPILQYAVQACPNMRWVPVSDYLGAK